MKTLVDCVSFIYACVLGAAQRMWALQKLRRLISANFGQTLNVNEILLSPSESAEQDMSRSFSVVGSIYGSQFVQQISFLDHLYLKSRDKKID